MAFYQNLGMLTKDGNKSFNGELFLFEFRLQFLLYAFYYIGKWNQMLQNVIKSCYVHHGYNLKDIEP